MAWYLVRYEMKVPTVVYQYLVEINPESADDPEKAARDIGANLVYNGTLPEPEIDLDNQDGNFRVLPMDDDDLGFRGLSPTDPEFKETIYGKSIIVPSEDK